MKKSYLFLGLGLLLIFLASCNLDTQADKDRTAIENYLKAHNLTAQKTTSGVYYIISTPGTGNHPTPANTVTAKYKGYLLDGTVFDQSTTGATFPLSNTIAGWQIGIPLFAKGGKGTIFIPSELGYGSTSAGNIPPNSVLIFDIELIDFQ